MPSISKPPSKAKGRTAKRGRPQVPPAATEEEVRALAFQLFQARGGEPGHELEDWLQAERELRGPTP